MKNLIITSILAVLIASATTVRAQDYPEEYLGLPGDNLNLYAVMDLFRNSETLEGFERSLNDPKSRINNLDLNRDNFVDYITVSDYIDRKVHTIVLRAVLGRKEYQDVAVFTVQKVGKKKVMIQLIGDEALYGRNYIIEPVYSKKFRHGYYGDPMYADNVTIINNYYYDIYEWPMIVYIYRPYYHGWHSSWYWGYYPDLLGSLETLLLGLLLRVPLMLEPSLQHLLPPLGLPEVQALQRLLLPRYPPAVGTGTSPDR